MSLRESRYSGRGLSLYFYLSIYLSLSLSLPLSPSLSLSLSPSLFISPSLSLSLSLSFSSHHQRYDNNRVVLECRRFDSRLARETIRRYTSGVCDIGSVQVVGGMQLWHHRDVQVHPSADVDVDVDVNVDVDARLQVPGEAKMDAKESKMESEVSIAADTSAGESSPGREEFMRLEAEVMRARRESVLSIMEAAQERAELRNEVESLKGQLEDAADDVSMNRHEREIAMGQLAEARCERNELSLRLSQQVNSNTIAAAQMTRKGIKSTFSSTFCSTP